LKRDLFQAMLVLGSFRGKTALNALG